MDAFISSVDRLNCDSMRFSWPAFIPSEQTSPFFEPLRDAILEKLSHMPVTEAISGTLVPPYTLWRVAGDFNDRSGKPLTLWADTKDIYLSPKYPSHVLSALYSLEVDNLTDERFLDDLEQMISGDQSRFHAQPDDWHSDLARALIPLTDDEDLGFTIRRLPIIPLMNGKWATTKSGPRIFPDDSDLGDLLVLNSVRIIHPAATTDANRGHLWSCLDIQNISRQDVCQYIVDAHSQPGSHPKIVGWTRAHLVAHARFLFLSNWRPSKPLDLWIQSTSGVHYKSSSAYLFDASYEDDAVARVIRQSRESGAFFVLHEDYRTITATEDGSNSASSSDIVSDYVSDNESDSSHEDSRSESPDVYLEDVEDFLFIGCSRAEVQEFKRWRTLRSNWDASLRKAIGLSDAPSPHGHDEWTSYLGEVLQVARLPRLAVTSYEPEDFGAYRMSKEFRRLFFICDVSDVLHLLISNWHHYSRFFEISGIQNKESEEELQELRDALWFDPDKKHSQRHPFKLANRDSKLLWDLQSTGVRTSTGRVPLFACVLPGIDSRFEDDADILLPTLKLAEYSAEVKARLKILSISVEADVRYYIKCLHALVDSRIRPSHERVSQIYAEIQKRYETDVGFIRYCQPSRVGISS